MLSIYKCIFMNPEPNDRTDSIRKILTALYHPDGPSIDTVAEEVKGDANKFLFPAVLSAAGLMGATWMYRERTPERELSPIFIFCDPEACIMQVGVYSKEQGLQTSKAIPVGLPIEVHWNETMYDTASNLLTALYPPAMEDLGVVNDGYILRAQLRRGDKSIFASNPDRIGAIDLHIRHAIYMFTAMYRQLYIMQLNRFFAENDLLGKSLVVEIPHVETCPLVTKYDSSDMHEVTEVRLSKRPDGWLLEPLGEFEVEGIDGKNKWNSFDEMMRAIYAGADWSTAKADGEYDDELLGERTDKNDDYDESYGL